MCGSVTSQVGGQRTTSRRCEFHPGHFSPSTMGILRIQLRSSDLRWVPLLIKEPLIKKKDLIILFVHWQVCRIQRTPCWSGFQPPQCRVWRWNPSCQAWWPEPLFTEPLHYLLYSLLKNMPKVTTSHNPIEPRGTVRKQMPHTFAKIIQIEMCHKLPQGAWFWYVL